MWITILARNDHQRVLNQLRKLFAKAQMVLFCIFYLWHCIACPLDDSHSGNIGCARIPHQSKDFWDTLYKGQQGGIDQRARFCDFDVTLFFLSFEHLSIPVMSCSNVLRPQSRPWPLTFTKISTSSSLRTKFSTSGNERIHFAGGCIFSPDKLLSF